jgi:hypothetical protein
MHLTLPLYDLNFLPPGDLGSDSLCDLDKFFAMMSLCLLRLLGSYKDEIKMR